MFQNCDGSEVLSGGSDGGTSIFIRLHSTAGLFAPCFVDFSLFFVQKGSKNAPGEAFPYDFGIECEKQRQTSVKGAVKKVPEKEERNQVGTWKRSSFLVQFSCDEKQHRKEL